MSGQDIKQIAITAMLCGTIITALILLYKVDKNARNDNDDKYVRHMINDEDLFKKRNDDKQKIAH